MDIFEGTEQIQQLVISRAISGLRIEQLTWANASCGRRTPGAGVLAGPRPCTSRVLERVAELVERIAEFVLRSPRLLALSSTAALVDVPSKMRSICATGP
jgi:hypothetical protein